MKKTIVVCDICNKEIGFSEVGRRLSIGRVHDMPKIKMDLCDACWANMIAWCRNQKEVRSTGNSR